MIDRGHNLPLGRQAELLGLSRGTLYYEPRPVPPAELAIMRRIDELHLDYPFAGSRMLRDLLRGEGVVIGRELVQRFHGVNHRVGVDVIEIGEDACLEFSLRCDANVAEHRARHLVPSGFAPFCVAGRDWSSV